MRDQVIHVLLQTKDVRAAYCELNLYYRIGMVNETEYDGIATELDAWDVGFRESIM